MSKENVVLFIKATNTKPELDEGLAGSNKLADWINIATHAGFEFTADEFASVIEETIEKKITAANAVREYLLARQTMGPMELSRKMTKLFIGGVSRTCDFWSFPGHATTEPQRVPETDLFR